MTQWCQFCDKEMRFDMSVVQIQGYTTCGKKKCVKQAADAAREIHDDDGEALIKRQESMATLQAELIVVFRSKTPHVHDSWEVVEPKEHPKFLLNPNIVADMLYTGDNAQDQDDNDDWWYHVLTTAAVKEAMEEADGAH